MLAELLLSAVIALLVLIAWQLWRRGSTQTQVAGDQVTLQALKADIVETNATVAELGKQVHMMAQALEMHFASDQQRNEQERAASVCSTGGHSIRPRIHN